MPTGDALLSGMYLNELLLRLLARADPHPALFDAYAGVVRVLASEHGDALEPVLRSFRAAAAARDRPAAQPGCRRP
jgi:DNA repair protein RecO (recombination protein O)